MTRSLAFLAALCCAWPVAAMVGGGATPSVEVYPGCPVPPSSWIASANLAVNQVWYIDPVNGSNANDGSALLTGGGHGPWQSVSALFSRVTGGGGENAEALLQSIGTGGPVKPGDIVYLAPGSYGSPVQIGVSEVEVANSTAVTLAAIPGMATPLFGGMIINESSGWVFKNIKIQPYNDFTFESTVLVDSDAELPASNIVFVGNEITSFGTGAMAAGLAGWYGSATAGSNIFTVTSMVPDSPPVTPGWTINWQGNTAATILPFGSDGTTGTGGAGTYALSATQTSAFPFSGAFLIMGAFNAAVLNSADTGIKMTGSAENCYSFVGNNIHDGVYNFLALGSSNTLIKGNDISHWGKSSTVMGNNPNVSFVGNLFHDPMSDPTDHPDMIQSFCETAYCNVVNFKYKGNTYIEHLDTHAALDLGSYGLFLGGGVHSQLFTNLDVEDNIFITSEYYAIAPRGIQGGIIANNIVASPDAFATALPGMIGGITVTDIYWPAPSASWSGGLANFTVTQVSGSPVYGDIGEGGLLTATGLSPSGYNGAWTVESVIGTAYAATVSSPGTGGGPGPLGSVTTASKGTGGPTGTYTGVAQASTSGSGSGATFTVVVNTSGVATSVTPTTTGEGSAYQNGDTIILQAGGGVPSGVTLTVATLYFAAVTQASTSGSGSGATWNLTVGSSGATAATNVAQGAGYEQGSVSDTITLTAGGGVPAGVILTVSGIDVISHAIVTMPSNPGSSSTAGGNVGYPSTNLLIENNVAPFFGINAPQSTSVSVDHNSAAGCSTCGSAGGITITRLGSSCSATLSVPCNDPNGNPTNVLLTQGSLEGTGAWRQWDPVGLHYDMRPAAGATMLIGRGAPFNTPNSAGQAYNPGHDLRGRPWPNPPDLGAVLH